MDARTGINHRVIFLLRNCIYLLYILNKHLSISIDEPIKIYVFTD